METSEKFQSVFKELIEDLDCKKYKIPQTIGIEYDVFTKIMEYGRIPKPVVLIRIADYFNISLEYLLGKTEVNDFVRSENPKSFHERYEELKEKRGLTDYEITKNLHISTSYTTNWKKRKYIPSLNNLILLTEIFKVTLDYLLGRTDYKD